MRWTQEEDVPHRKGSFHEDRDALLTRFAHKGTRAALDDQLARAKDKGARRPQKRSAFNFHDVVRERAQH